MSAGAEQRPELPYGDNTRGADMRIIARAVADVQPFEMRRTEPLARAPLKTDQETIVRAALENRDDIENALEERFAGQFAQGLTRERLLHEYTTVQLARQHALIEFQLQRTGNFPFFVHGAGMEVTQVLLARHMDNQDALVPYYRGQVHDLYRGGNVDAFIAQAANKVGDTHSESKQLAGHPASRERSIIPAISMTGPQVLPAVGIGTNLNDRLDRENASNTERFSRKDAIALVEFGEATMAEGSVMEGVSQAVKDKAATVMVCYNNLGGISMDLHDSSVNGDPVLYARAYADQGLHLVEVDSTDLDALAEATRDVVQHTREDRGPSLLHVQNIYRVTDHTSSSDQVAFTPPDELERRKGFDMLPAYRHKLIDNGVATEEELTGIDELAKARVRAAADEVMKRPTEDPKRVVYKDTYHPDYTFGPSRVSDLKFVPTVDRLESTRRVGEKSGVEYIKEKRPDGLQLTGRMHINLTLAEEMKRDPTIVVYGEDTAQFSRDQWDILPKVLEQRVRQKNLKDSEHEARAYQALEAIMEGEGHAANPEDLAAFAHIMDGKGGVFKRTQFLDVLFGRRRNQNFPIRENSIIGTAIGRAMAGELPVVEIQFDAYSSPAYEQLHDYLSTLRWRGAGQFDAGMVIRMQGMNRVGGDGITKAGGVGGYGHGMADINRFLVPGIRHFIPGDPIEMGAGLRESIRVAREHREPVIVWEPINLNMDMAPWQGSNKHIPLGEAEARRRGNDAVIVTWSNNVKIADAVADKLGETGMSVGVVNTRGFTDHFDWKTIEQEVEPSGKVIVFEAGRMDGAWPTAQIQQQMHKHLDAPVVWLPARYVPMPAGEDNERYVVPQYQDLLETTEGLLRF